MYVCICVCVCLEKKILQKRKNTGSAWKNCFQSVALYDIIMWIEHKSNL